MSYSVRYLIVKELMPKEQNEAEARGSQGESKVSGGVLNLPSQFDVA